MTDAPTPAATRPDVAPWRLAATLAVAGALAGLLLVFVDQATRPRIEAHRRAALADAVKEVLAVDPDSGDGSRIVSLRVSREGIVPEEETTYEVDAVAIDRVFLGYGADGKVAGFAIVHQQIGFQDVIRLIFGYDAKTRTVLSLRVLESKETPGLGDKIEKDAAWVAQFHDRTAPIRPVKAGERDAPDEVDTITGATISSKAVIEIVNAALARDDLAERLALWLREAGT